MVEVRLTEGQGSVVKQAVEAMKELVENVYLDCKGRGLSFEALDIEQGWQVELLLPSGLFQHYHCHQDISMGINLHYLAHLLQCAAASAAATANQHITITAHPNQQDHHAISTATFKFMFQTPTQDKITDFEINLIMDINSEYQWRMPEAAEFKAIARMPSAEFERICRDLSIIGDTVEISVTNEDVKFSTTGDLGTVNIVCRRNVSTDEPEEGTVIEMQEPVTLRFALTYLKNFTKATPLANRVTICLSQSLPMLVEYNIAEMGYLRFYLSPMIEEDEADEVDVEWANQTQLSYASNYQLGR